jgi:argininosuccinate lyase
MKLWQKDNTVLSKLTETFTVGNDRDFDLMLAPYDVQGTLAHVQMLRDAGLLPDEDHVKIRTALEEILQEIQEGKFVIEPGVEDVHSQVEVLVTRRIGDAGKKIHTGRSRNDQVAVDIKLFLRDEILKIKDQAAALFETLIDLAGKYSAVLLPGYTHLQVAMPSSFGLWLSAYAESLSDDADLLAAAWRMTQKNPLGSGAGYGSSFPLNRARTTALLGFQGMHYSSVYAQMSRGKTERTVAVACSALAATMGRLAMDLCLYMNQNFGFVSFPDELTTGSSIMPHKKNPDIFELVRARCSRIQSVPNELTLLTQHLPSGYHRDVQLTKEILFPALVSLGECFEIMIHALPQMRVRTDILQEDRYQYLFTVEAVNDLVKKGVPFRDAYRQVGNEVMEGRFTYEGFDISNHTHEGSMGNLCLDEIRNAFEQVLQQFLFPVARS